MDNIQKELIRLGRKDLAEEYHNKVAIKKGKEKFTIEVEYKGKYPPVDRKWLAGRIEQGLRKTYVNPSREDDGILRVKVKV